MTLPSVGLDMPKELVADVNKPPFPVVNIIVEAPAQSVSAAHVRATPEHMSSTGMERTRGSRVRGATSLVHLPPGIPAGLYGDKVHHSDFEVVVHTPVESLLAERKSLDGVMQVEDMRRASDEKRFYDEKQSILTAEKASLRGIVREVSR